METNVKNKRVLVTHADRYMGPACVEVFRQEGAEVIADNSDLSAEASCREVVGNSGVIDVLVVNLASPNHYGTLVTDLDEASWSRTFDLLVHPLHRLV